MRLPMILTPTQAQTEAVMLLDRYYRTAHDHAFNAALLDVMDTRHNGLELVLTILVDIIKQRQQEEFAKSVYVDVLAPLSWEQRCALVSEIRQRCKAFLPDEVLACSPAQLADEIPELFSSLITLRDVLPKRYAS